MIDNVHQANRILLSFLVREKKHREYAFRFDPAKRAEKVGQCDTALERLEYMLNGGPVPFQKSYIYIKGLINGEIYWRGRIFSGKQREDKIADCNQALAALDFLHEALSPQPEAEQIAMF